MSHDGPTPGMNHVQVPPAVGEGTPAAPPPSPYVPAPPPPVYLSGQQPPEPLYTLGSPPPPAYSPPAQRPRAPVAGIIAIASAIVITIVVLCVAVASLLSGLGQIDSAPPPAPVPGEPSEPSVSSEPSEPDPNDTTVDGSVEPQLQGLLDRYKTSRTDGSLWEQIPNTAFNHTAVSAFLYIITDMKLALSFGGDSEGYLEEAAELERRLLNEEPLGTDISIKLSDRTFTYDGTTGAGGYTDN